MKRDQLVELHRLGAVSCSVLAGLLIAAPAHAQVIPDASLPQRSRATSRGNTTIITGGTQSGTNLFHSFEEFSVPTGGIASFQDINPNINNLISRITGSSISNIDGVLEALQTNGAISSANFFLINPNGIVFGSNASLNLGGSFVATTGDRLLFSDGTEFRADGSQSSLLTVSVPDGIQFGQAPGAIRNQSRVNFAEDEFGNPLRGGLQVAPGRTLALVGSQIAFAGGVLTAAGGRIELGSVDDFSLVHLHTTESGWRLAYDEAQFQNIRFSQASHLIANGIGGGSIQIQGRRIALTDRSSVLSFTQGNLHGGNISVRANQLFLGRLSRIATATQSSGDSGNITIFANQLNLTDGAQVSSRTLNSGSGGNITIAANSIDLSGRGGFFLSADGDLFFNITGLYSQSAASGSAGALTILTRNLHLSRGAQINATAFGSGNSGVVRIEAETIDLAGVFSFQGEPLLDSNGRPLPSGFFTGTRQANDRVPTGNGGDVTITTASLTLQDGAAIKTNTEGSGNSGNLFIRASESIAVSGIAGLGLPPSFILAASGGVPNIPGSGDAVATGRGGTLDIRTGELRVEAGAAIAVGSLNPAGNARGAGELRIHAQTVDLEDQGRLLAETNSGDGGNITLQVEDLLFLRRKGQISTTAGNAETGGDGGNININTPNGWIITAPSDDSDITANAFEGNGGEVEIITRSLFGLEARDRQTSLSDITASSEFGLSGSVQISTLDIDPTQGLTELPTELATPTIEQRCYAQTISSTSEFISSGQGGLPPDPSVINNSGLVWDDLRSPLSSPTDRPLSTMTLPPLPSSPEPIVEAQGWVVGEDGQVMLVAQPPFDPTNNSTNNSTNNLINDSYRSWHNSLPCPAS
ncbi:MAG: hypothetical protein Kow00121_13040 [Elainellaceae cyanobacterium]